MRDTNQSGVPVVVFAIGYGKDADCKTLKTLSDATGGQAREGTVETIKQLYKILSTYFLMRGEWTCSRSRGEA